MVVRSASRDEVWAPLLTNAAKSPPAPQPPATSTSLFISGAASVIYGGEWGAPIFSCGTHCFKFDERLRWGPSVALLEMPGAYA